MALNFEAIILISMPSKCKTTLVIALTDNLVNNSERGIIG